GRGAARLDSGRRPGDAVRLPDGARSSGGRRGLPGLCPGAAGGGLTLGVPEPVAGGRRLDLAADGLVLRQPARAARRSPGSAGQGRGPGRGQTLVAYSAALGGAEVGGPVDGWGGSRQGPAGAAAGSGGSGDGDGRGASLRSPLLLG